MQLRRIATAGHIVFIAFWKGELLPNEAAAAIEIVLALCQILNTRWEAAAKVRLDFEMLTRASGESALIHSLPINFRHSSNLLVRPYL
jgi:hypothetical protein